MHVETEGAPDAQVRCLECHTVYDSSADGSEDAAQCPDCGATGWLAASIPVADDPAPA